VLDIVTGLDPALVKGFCYGAGFEKQAEVLNRISQYLQVLGNAGEVIVHCKNPRRFFATCDALSIPHPEVVFDMPESADGWLVKVVGASGGAHIKPLDLTTHQPSDAVYLQQQQVGTAISCLFLADGHQVQIVGFNELWLDGTVDRPFRYGGAVSHACLTEQVKCSLQLYVEKLTREIGLVGINSCDAIYDGDHVYILEINPRLSATMALYDSKSTDLMARHIQSCGEPIQGFSVDKSDQTSLAHQVIYADQSIEIDHGIDWPEWAADIPNGGSQFEMGMPICTVVARADGAEQAKRLVNGRARALTEQFFN